MEQTLKNLNKSIEEYTTIQQKQLESFEKELMPDLDSQRFERAAAFAQLKIHLDQFMNIVNYQANLELVRYYRDQLSQIITTDGIMGEKIYQYKTELKRHMNDTKKGSAAFKGYARSIKPSIPKTICFSH